MQVLDSLDSGLVVLDSKHEVCAWNGFMQSYSGIEASDIIGKRLMDFFPDIPWSWLNNKIKTASVLKTRCFSSWEYQPYLFKFRNFSPMSHHHQYMYQDIIFTPIIDLKGEVSHTAIQINDVSESAHSKILLRKNNQALTELSRRDGLSGLFNRAYWEETLKNQFNYCRVAKKICTLVMFDIDNFKVINDTYGHPAGDEVIRHVSQLLLKTARKSDICGRYGGEEFTVLLPDTTLDQAKYFADRLRRRVEESVVYFEGARLSFTISVGVSLSSDIFEDYTDWLSSVDFALYQSKRNGKNQVSLAQKK
ncbi:MULTISPECIES: diguanylate cyclase [unclassified Vibrio]|uniref:diguanylate cyclase n=1 Tax=Vibrio sp. HB236076 TaxID=3232307 RepID=A0AB39HIX0_9VIBR|nr:diguanylate cyclase [Vibrio sp. HB161653]MDP5253421.1 diguanylate cyclase [Vibrio sp. HB161653]